MIKLLLPRRLLKFFKKQKRKIDFWNIPFVLWGKLSTYLAKRLTFINNGRSAFPRLITFYLTESCNLNCKMCFLKQIKTKKNFIPLETAKKLINDLMCVRPLYNMTGGEPFLYPYIEELITYIKSKGLHLSIVTNGTLIEDFAEMIVHSGVDKLNISIDGTPEKHDTIRRVPGAFSKTLKGIRAINYEKKKQGKGKPRLSLYSLLSSEADVEFIISFAQENLFEEVNFLHLLSISAEDLKKFSEKWKVKPHYWKGAVINGKDFRVRNSLVRKIKSYINDPTIKMKIRFTPDVNETDLGNYYNKDKEFLDKFRGKCIGPWVAATIKPPAKVEICPDLPIGDLTHRSFLQIWNGEKPRKIRKQIFKGNMLSVCGGCCNYYM